jgi:hypothetical protein
LKVKSSPKARLVANTLSVPSAGTFASTVVIE